eukprot:11344176-Prorocentrum_lima.AAC.1
MVTYVLTPGSTGRLQVNHGLHPTQLKPPNHLARSLSEKPDDSNPTIQRWLGVEDPDGQNMWIKGWSYPMVRT